ncbi:DHA2 family efflux MFS transporter permease subunit [Williamsia sterculiae]|nr:DHA2 family efflux MFS transporter permease subunit [Williamsia sterculiae]
MSTTIADGLTPRRKTIILVTCCMSLLIVSMDATIVNVALPSIREELGASVSGLQWVIDVYTLVLASLLMISGAMADRYGRRRVFQIGLVVFAAGSLACSLAPTVGVLIAARALQAIGGSMLNPVAMSIITQVFTEQRERARAIGLWGAVVGISMAVGPIVGGVLIDSVGWRGVFWINLPICLVTCTLAAIFVPESKSPVMRTLDPVGQALAIVALASLVFGLIEGPGLGWSSASTIVIFAVAVVAGSVFVGWERSHPDPFIDLRFFRSVPFSSATVIAVAAFAGYGAFLFLMSIYLQEVRGLSAVMTGVMFLPLAAATLICSPLSGRLVGRYGTRPSLVVSGVTLIVCTTMMATLSDLSVTTLLVAFALFGIGFGVVNAPITNAAVSGMPRHRAGAASAVASTSRQIGVSIGVALAGTITGVSTSSALPRDLVTVMHPMWWTVCALSLLILTLGVASSTAWARRSSDGVARRLIDPEPVHA